MSESRGQPIDDLLAIMARLRDPDGGCPWDLQQDHASIASYTIEEAYEVADAIDRGDHDDLRDELGDLLLQVVLHAQMAREAGRFDFDDVARAISEKMVRRHPHVFGNQRYADAAAQKQTWEENKAAERSAGGQAPDASALAGVSHGLPDYRRAQKLQQRAANVGFDWPGPTPVLDKLAEELDELRAEFDAGSGRDRLQDELGDMLFVMVNLARHADVDFSAALRHANAKFERRFRRMEAFAQADGSALDQLDLVAQEALWQRVKREEREGQA